MPRDRLASHGAHNIDRDRTKARIRECCEIFASLTWMLFPRNSGTLMVQGLADPRRYEVFLDGRWFTFDARHNHPRIGRIVIARGRDAADVAISTAFGRAQLVRFKVMTEELKDASLERLLKEAA